MIIDFKLKKPTHLIIKEIKNFTEAAQYCEELNIPISLLESC